MGLENIVGWIIIGIVAGFLAGKVVEGSGMGPFVDMVVGLIGAVIGGFVMSQLIGKGTTGVSLWSLIVSFIGAVILLAIFRALSGGRRRSVV